MINYDKQYLNLATEDYRTTWWKLVNCADTSTWNVLLLVELVFLLPVSNASVERVFSQTHRVKYDWWCSLSEDRLDQLIRIAVDGVPLQKWDATQIIQLWWKDKQRRPAPRLQSTDRDPLNLEKKPILHLIWRIGTDIFVIKLM